MTSLERHGRGISETSPASRIAIAIWFAGSEGLILLLQTVMTMGGSLRPSGLWTGDTRVALLFVAAAGAFGAWLGPAILRATAEETDAWRIGISVGALAGIAFVVPHLLVLGPFSGGPTDPGRIVWLLALIWPDVIPAVIGGFAGWTLWLIVGAGARRSERRS